MLTRRLAIALLLPAMTLGTGKVHTRTLIGGGCASFEWRLLSRSGVSVFVIVLRSDVAMGEVFPS